MFALHAPPSFSRGKARGTLYITRRILPNFTSILMQDGLFANNSAGHALVWSWWLVWGGGYRVGGDAGLVITLLMIMTTLTIACQLVRHMPSTSLRTGTRVRRVVASTKYLEYRASAPSLPFCTDVPITKGVMVRSMDGTCHTFSVARVRTSLRTKRPLGPTSLTGVRGIVLSKGVPRTGCCLIR